MTRFTENEREYIRSELIDAGGELFAKHGFDRTRISDITDRSRIGTSTFYQFFDSKKAIYIEVLRHKRQQLNQRINTEVSKAESPEEEVQMLLETLFEEIRNSPLISRLIIDNELQQLQERLSEKERQHIRADSQYQLRYAEQWADDESFRYNDPELVRGLFQSFVFLTRAKDSFPGGTDAVEYERVERELIDLIADGLFLD